MLLTIIASLDLIACRCDVLMKNGGLFEVKAVPEARLLLLFGACVDILDDGLVGCPLFENVCAR